MEFINKGYPDRNGNAPLSDDELDGVVGGLTVCEGYYLLDDGSIMCGNYYTDYDDYCEGFVKKPNGSPPLCNEYSICKKLG